MPRCPLRNACVRPLGKGQADPKPKQSKAKQSKAKQSKAKQSKAKQSNTGGGVQLLLFTTQQAER
jgi:hypothetical protein